MALLDTAMRGLLFCARLLQWCSAVIVMGIVAFFLHKGPKGQHLKYEIVIVRCIYPSLEYWSRY